MPMNDAPTLPRALLPALAVAALLGLAMLLGHALKPALNRPVQALRIDGQLSRLSARQVAEAAALAQLPREAYARMKRMLQPTAEEFDRVLQSEEDAQAALLQGPAFREGYAAMRDKRAADFIGSGA